MLAPAEGRRRPGHAEAACGANAKTANAEATLKVLKSLTSAENMAFMAEGDYVTARSCRARDTL